jgi:hypothetical protein
MSAWTSPNGEGSAHFATSIPGLERRVALWARANGIPAPPRVLGAVFARLQAPGSPFELEEREVRTDDGSTHAPHLRGPRQTGQVRNLRLLYRDAASRGENAVLHRGVKCTTV